MRWRLTRFQTVCLAVGGALLLGIGAYFHDARLATGQTCSLGVAAPMQKAAFEAVLKDFDTVLRRDPDSVSALVGRGTAFLALGNPDRAVPDLDRAAQLSPHDAAIQCHLAAAYLGRNEPAWALTYADSAIALSPRNAGAHLVRAASLRQLGRIDEAAAVYGAVIALEPGNMTAHVQRGDIHFQLKKYALAVADLAPPLAQSRDAWTLNKRCWYRAAWGRQLHEALADCDAAIAMQGGNAGFRDVRGLVRYRLGDHEGAIADFDTALKIAPDLETALYVRGLARRRLGDSAGGDADIAAAQARNSSVAQDFDDMGVTP